MANLRLHNVLERGGVKMTMVWLQTRLQAREPGIILYTRMKLRITQVGIQDNITTTPHCSTLHVHGTRGEQVQYTVRMAPAYHFKFQPGITLSVVTRRIIGHAPLSTVQSVDISLRRGVSTAVHQAVMGAAVVLQQNFALGFVQKATIVHGQPHSLFHVHLTRMRRQVVWPVRSAPIVLRTQ